MWICDPLIKNTFDKFLYRVVLNRIKLFQMTYRSSSFSIKSTNIHPRRQKVIYFTNLFFQAHVQARKCRTNKDVDDRCILSHHEFRSLFVFEEQYIGAYGEVIKSCRHSCSYSFCYVKVLLRFRGLETRNIVVQRHISSNRIC